MTEAVRKKASRRSDITRALYQCIVKQGYANVRFNDIAMKAGISPSHLGYYFANKAAVLEYYALALCRKNIDELPTLTEPDIPSLIQKLADFCFAPSMMNRDLAGVVSELNGLAVHDESLNAIKSGHTSDWKAYLQKLFRRAHVSDPRLCATKAHALLVGLNTDVLFDEALTLEEAASIFKDMLFELCELPHPSTA